MDVFIKSFNRPHYLDRCLRSIQTHLTGVSSIRVLDDGTPNIYLDEIARRHPGIEIIRSPRHSEKAHYLQHYGTRDTPPPAGMGIIPWDMWHGSIQSASQLFLLMEDDQWCVRPLDLRQIQHTSQAHHFALIRLFRCPVFDCGPITSLTPGLSKITPWYFQTPLHLRLYHACLTNRYKCASLLRQLRLLQRDWILSAYALYVVTGIFDKTFWLSVTDTDAGIRERTQLTNALVWARHHPEATFARTDSDHIVTTFRSSASGTRLDADTQFDMLLCNKLLSQHWLAGTFDSSAGMPQDLSAELIHRLLTNAGDPRCPAAHWPTWCHQFAAGYQELGLTIEPSPSLTSVVAG